MVRGELLLQNIPHPFLKYMTMIGKENYPLTLSDLTGTLVPTLNFRLWNYNSTVKTLSIFKYNYELLLFVSLGFYFPLFAYCSKYVLR